MADARLCAQKLQAELAFDEMLKGLTLVTPASPRGSLGSPQRLTPWRRVLCFGSLGPGLNQTNRPFSKCLAVDGTLGSALPHTAMMQGCGASLSRIAFEHVLPSTAFSERFEACGEGE